ncbi:MULTISPECIES: FmdB family zinc ribbon protein [Candidatus Ichthyocystis]|uniref:Putative regulatory protein, FmdB family n=1 Tax=Candidatus Ichthyocystis hellenicum TaxID=1561003 RepID=A0A0S4M404_9BURK|nr:MULTISPECIES: zinc ribbon domain-containing protein [Ichthyocystis]CUT17450.1 putative regulatory protein, FmdB family [Candidatus Ichthyocystis hellenicum]
MPTYSYYCKSCGYESTHWQKISDPHIVECPSCSSKSYCRRISAPSFSLKGSGWYATDFRAPATAADKNSELKSCSGGENNKPTLNKDTSSVVAPIGFKQEGSSDSKHDGSSSSKHDGNSDSK